MDADHGGAKEGGKSACCSRERASSIVALPKVESLATLDSVYLSFLPDDASGGGLASVRFRKRFNNRKGPEPADQAQSNEGRK